MKALSLSLIIVMTTLLAACGQTSSITFKKDPTSLALPIQFASGSSISNGGGMNMHSTGGAHVNLTIGAPINRVNATSTLGAHVQMGIIGQTSN